VKLYKCFTRTPNFITTGQLVYKLGKVKGKGKIIPVLNQAPHH